MDKELEAKINDLIRVSGLAELKIGNFSKHLEMCVEAWGLLPEPKLNESEAFHIVDFILMLAMKLNDLETLEKWKDLMLKASPQRIDAGEREFKVAKVELFLGNEDKAFNLLEIANKKSKGRCFAMDKTIKPFFQNRLKNNSPINSKKSNAAVKKSTTQKAKPCSKKYMSDFEGNILKFKWSDNKHDWLLQKKYKKAFEIASILLGDEDIGNIENLTIGCWCNNESSQDIIDKMILNAEQFSSLKTLVVGIIYGEEYFISRTLQCNYSYLWKAFGKLESLSVLGTEGLILGDIKHNKLKHLEIISVGMPNSVLEDINNGELPNLQELVLNIGRSEFGYQLNTNELLNFINRLEKFTKLTHLGICNTENTLEAIQVVSNSNILSKLKTLDFSKGVLYDECGQFIVDNIDKFNHLDSITLEFNYFSGDMLDKLHNLPIRINTFEGLVKDPNGKDKPYYCE